MKCLLFRRQLELCGGLADGVAKSADEARTVGRSPQCRLRFLARQGHLQFRQRRVYFARRQISIARRQQGARCRDVRGNFVHLAQLAIAGGGDAEIAAQAVEAPQGGGADKQQADKHRADLQRHFAAKGHV